MLPVVATRIRAYAARLRREWPGRSTIASNKQHTKENEVKAFGNYIKGEFVDSKSGRTFPNINPANIDEVVGNFQASNEADVEDACAAAVAAQEEWAATPATKRGEYL